MKKSALIVAAFVTALSTASAIYADDAAPSADNAPAATAPAAPEAVAPATPDSTTPAPAADDSTGDDSGS